MISRPLATRFALALLAAAPLSFAAPLFTLKSPNGKLAFTLEQTSDGHLAYALAADGQPVIKPSALGLRVDGLDLGANAAPTGAPQLARFDETFPTKGVHDQAVSHANAALLAFTAGEKKIPWKFEVRIADDGAAFRYLLPGAGAARHLDGEATEWTLPAGSTLWFQGDENRAYEDRYRPGRVDELQTGLKIMVPATAKLPGDLGYAMLTEANVVDYSDMALELTGPRKFRALFHDDPQGWPHKGDVTSPWRVTLYAPNLNALVNTDFLEALCPPPLPALADAPWIRPGRSIWHWLNGGLPVLEAQHGWIDGTKAMGYEYYLIDDGWKRWNGGGDQAWNALADLVRYAKTQGVAIWVWVNSEEVFTPKDREAYFRRMKRIGVVGLKIDFPHPANTEWVQWYDDTLRDAATAKLMLDFHGAMKPTGRTRTWPNEMTREAVSGREQGKLPASHDTALPFVRYVQGHADYTPVLLIPDHLNGSTFPHEMAMGILYTSPFLCFGDRPQNYLASPAADVLKAIPSTWNETRVLPGSEIGELAAFARRHGRDWFIAVLGGQERKLPVTLDFLGDGPYTLVSIADDPAKNDAVVRTERTVKRGDVIDVSLRLDGGFIGWLRPKGQS